MLEMVPFTFFAVNVNSEWLLSVFVGAVWLDPDIMADGR